MHWSLVRQLSASKNPHWILPDGLLFLGCWGRLSKAQLAGGFGQLLISQVRFLPLFLAAIGD